MSAVCNAARSVGEWAARYRATAMRMCRPASVLPHAVNCRTRIQHLITVEACIFAQHCTCKRGDKRYTSGKEIAETDHNRFTLFPQDT
jgi:hypothetical protein